MQHITIEEPKRKRGRPRRPEGALPPTTATERKAASRARMAALKPSLGDDTETIAFLVLKDQTKRIRTFAKELNTHPVVILTHLAWPLLTEFQLYADRTPESRLSDIDNNCKAAEVARNLGQYAGLPNGTQLSTSNNWPRPHFNYLKELLACGVSNKMIAEIFNAERFEPPTGEQWTSTIVALLLKLYGLSRNAKD